MGPNCMISTVDKQLTNGVIAYWCNNSGCGPVKGAMSVQLTYAVCAFSSAEMNQRGLLLDKNGLESPFSVMSQCPNGKCGKYIFREDESKVRVQCVHCKTYICWFCKKTHNKYMFYNEHIALLLWIHLHEI